MKQRQMLGSRYALEECIGEGATARVYRAQDTFLNRVVAVKVLRPQFADDEFVRRFRREARAAAALVHPNIVAVYDVGVDDGQHYIVMEFVDGETLKERIRRLGPIPIAEAARFASAILAALECAHRAGIVHRDVKPQNVLLTRDGTVKVTDFGIARASASVTATLTAMAGGIGTAHYVSPEQANGKPADERADLYSCGVVLYEMLSGRVPFDGDGALAVALRHVQEPPVPLRKLNPDVPPALEKVVERAMAKDPGGRYATAAAFSEDLRRAVAGQQLTPSARLGEATEARPRRAPRRRRTWLAFTIAVLGFFGVLGYRAALAWLVVPTVRVPNIMHRSLADAEDRLRAAHLSDQVVSSQASTAPPTVVIASDPPPGALVRVGRTVDLTISTGPDWVHGGVPDVHGLSGLQATTRLQDAGLSVHQSPRYDDTNPVGVAIGTEPPAHAQVAVGATVDLILSQGPKPAPLTLPDLVGQKLADAAATLAANHLSPGTVSYALSGWPAGIVEDTTPKAGAPVQLGQSVDLLVSSGCQHSTTLTLRTVTPGSDPVSVEVTVTDATGTTRDAFNSTVAPGAQFPVSFCWAGDAAAWAEYENGATTPSQQGTLAP